MRKGSHHSEKTRELMKISNLGKGHPMSEEHKEKLRYLKKGNLHYKIWSEQYPEKAKIINDNFRLRTIERNKQRAGYKHTEEWKQMMSERTKGGNHWAWKENREELKMDNQHQYDYRYKCWMKEVKNRDRWKCKSNNEECNGRLEAHHICPWKDFPELRYDINNGITLCVFHHPRKREEENKLKEFFNHLVQKSTVERTIL